MCTPNKRTSRFPETAQRWGWGEVEGERWRSDNSSKIHYVSITEALRKLVGLLLFTCQEMIISYFGWKWKAWGSSIGLNWPSPICGAPPLSRNLDLWADMRNDQEIGFVILLQSWITRLLITHHPHRQMCSDQDEIGNAVVQAVCSFLPAMDWMK